MYKILIANGSNYTFAMEAVEVMEQITAKNAAGEDVTVYNHTGNYNLVVFERETFNEVKEKYKELLNNHKVEELNIIKDVTETVTIDVSITESAPSGSPTS